MEVIKKYTALRMETNTQELGMWTTVVECRLDHGENYSIFYKYKKAKTVFDTEEEALKYAYEMDPAGTWMVVPIFQFVNYV